MFKKINNWHLSILIVVVSVLSIAMVQQYALAQWEAPTTNPGTTISSNILLNPLTEDVVMGTYNIGGDNLTLDADGENAVTVENGARICLGGVCEAAWPSGGTGTSLWEADADGIHPESYARVGIGRDAYNGSFPLVVDDDSGAGSEGSYLKLKSGKIWAFGTDFDLEASADMELKASGGDIYTTYGTSAPEPHFGIGAVSPDYSLHVADNNTATIVNLDDFYCSSTYYTDQSGCTGAGYTWDTSRLWNGVRLARNGSEQWFVGMNDTDDNLSFRNQGSVDAMSLSVDSAQTNMKLSGDDTAFLTIDAFDSWDDSIHNVGINFKRNDWQTDQYTDYAMSIKYGSLYLNSYYTYPPDTGPLLSGTPLFIKDIGSGSGGAADAGYVGINNTSPMAQLDVYDNEDMGAAILGSSDSSVGGVGVAGASMNGATANAVGVLGVNDSPGMTGGSNITAGVFGMSNVSGGMGVVGAQGAGGYAGYFDGYVEIDKGSSTALYALNIIGGATVKNDGNNYMQLDYISTTPDPADCSADTAKKGRMIFQYSSSGPGKLWLCNYTGWESVTLTP